MRPRRCCFYSGKVNKSDKLQVYSVKNQRTITLIWDRTKNITTMTDVMDQFVKYHSRLYSKQTPDLRKTKKYLNTIDTKFIDQLTLSKASGIDSIYVIYYKSF